MLEKFNKLIEFKVEDDKLNIVFKSENYTYSMNKEEANELVGDLYELTESFDEYDKEKYPKYVYQKALINQIIIDIINEDEIVKKIIKKANRNPRFTTLIDGKNFKL